MNGFKLTNDTAHAADTMRILNFFKENSGYFLEAGFYFDRNEMDSHIIRNCSDETDRVNLHSGKRTSLFSITEGDQAFLDDLKLARQINSTYSVLHLTPSRSFDAAYDDDVKKTRSIQYLRILNYLAGRNNYKYFIENTYHNIDFYIDIFNGVLRYKLQNIHFCFDIGHARLWSGNNIDQWDIFLKSLQANDIELHFHISMNHGYADEHLSFVEFDGGTKDSFSGYRTYNQIIQDIALEFPYSRKIYEVRPLYALANMKYVDSLFRELEEVIV